MTSREDTLATLAPEDELGGPTDFARDGSKSPSIKADRALIDDRYEDLGLIGEGGFGEVRRALDHKLGRAVAMKILHADLAASPALRQRLVNEARLVAKLQHPAIVGVYDFGELTDGRVWMTMPELSGRTLAAVLADATSPHAAERSFAWSPRRLLDAFARACQAVAFAHRAGVIHRDLKPDNVMLGDLGEVIVMDWGLARLLDRGPEGDLALAEVDAAHEEIAGATTAPSIARITRESKAFLTRAGDVLGTPAYMAPEQARGEVHLHGPSLDVYALGAILYHLLAGRPPFAGSSRAVIARVISGPPARLADLGVTEGGSLADLCASCERAMARDPSARHKDATQLASEILNWLDGVQRRERALTMLRRAGASGPSLSSLRDRAEALRSEAKSLFTQIKPYAPAEEKAPAWDRLDEAQRLSREAALREVEWIRAVEESLVIDPSLDEAHQVLADHHREALTRAEAEGRPEDAVRAEAQLRAHDRGRHAAFLSGLGALSIRTDPEGAIAILHRYVERRRRLIPEHVAHLGPTPILDHALPHGSYRVDLVLEDRVVARYPVWIGRGERWDGRPPDRLDPFAIPLPKPGDLDPDEIYIPAGYAWTGGDPEAPDSLPRRRVWIDGFVIGRFPVTNAAFLDFLNDLLSRGDEAAALAACPRGNRGTLPGADDHLAYDRAPDGRFCLRSDDPGEAWQLDGPTALISYRGAVDYVTWLGRRTGRPYRLPHELEREKAARGADARRFPWGNTFDPSWACVLESTAGEPGRVPVTAFPDDESPYGVRGLAGNTRDLCGNPWRHEGPKIEADRLLLTSDTPTLEDHIAARGGAWSSVAHLCGAAGRFGIRADHRRSTLGLRVARSFP